MSDFKWVRSDKLTELEQNYPWPTSAIVPGGEKRGQFSSFSWCYDFTCPKCYATVYVERFGFDYPEEKE